MKHLLAAALVVALSGPALAQTATTTTPAPAANPDPSTPAVKTDETAMPAMPAKGANSFTEMQAKERLEKHGFTNVMGLAKDKDGVWRGKAMKGGASHEVAVDYQGNVFPH